MDWWPGMNGYSADMNGIDASLFDPWINCDDLDFGTILHQSVPGGVVAQQSAALLPASSSPGSQVNPNFIPTSALNNVTNVVTSSNTTTKSCSNQNQNQNQNPNLNQSSFVMYENGISSNGSSIDQEASLSSSLATSATNNTTNGVLANQNLHQHQHQHLHQHQNQHLHQHQHQQHHQSANQKIASQSKQNYLFNIISNAAAMSYQQHQTSVQQQSLVSSNVVIQPQTSISSSQSQCSSSSSSSSTPSIDSSSANNIINNININNTNDNDNDNNNNSTTNNSDHYSSASSPNSASLFIGKESKSSQPTSLHAQHQHQDQSQQQLTSSNQLGYRLNVGLATSTCYADEFVNTSRRASYQNRAHAISQDTETGNGQLQTLSLQTSLIGAAVDGPNQHPSARPAVNGVGGGQDKQTSLAARQQGQKVKRCRHLTDYVLAEEEKRLLIKEGYTNFPMSCQSRPLSKSEERILRKIRRKIRNKRSAQCSRQRKKEYVEDLERKYAAVIKENEELKQIIHRIQQQ